MGDAKTHSEIELKRLLIGEGAADRFVHALGTVATDVEQVNHVFDTPDLRLNHNRYAVRLRSEAGELILTAKGPSRSVSAHVTSRAEAEAKVEKAVADMILARRLDPIAALRERATDVAFDELWRGLERARAGQSLHEVGQFKNRRRTVLVIVPPDITLHVEVDQTHFPNGKVDEEVEIEIHNAELASVVESWLDSAAAAAGIQTQASSPKLVRFFASRDEGTRSGR